MSGYFPCLTLSKIKMAQEGLEEIIRAQAMSQEMPFWVQHNLLSATHAPLDIS